MNNVSSIYNKLPITAIIICKNEGYLLGKCLNSILFCEEIIVINLESTDNTIAVASNLGAKVLTIPTMPVGEMIYYKYLNVAKYDWILMTDPDEVTPSNLKEQIYELFELTKSENKIGAFYAPIVYFFKKHRLIGTSWGGVKYRPYLYHRDKTITRPIVHTGISIKETFKPYYIDHNGKNHIDHFWAHGYMNIFEKHLRYLKNEGKSRFEQGYTTTLRKISKMPTQQFFNCFIRKRGFKDGIIGLFLSFFRAWYFTAAEIELYKYQNKVNKKL
jgi:glycosyltransferase involved in cell wall biosynthesis